jgi:hypothetical protein
MVKGKKDYSLPIIVHTWTQKQLDIISAEITKATNNFFHVVLASEIESTDKEEDDFAYLFTDKEAYDKKEIVDEGTTTIFTFEEKGTGKTKYGYMAYLYEPAHNYKDGSGVPPTIDAIEGKESFDSLVLCIEFLILNFFTGTIAGAVSHASYNLAVQEDKENIENNNPE